MPPKKPVITKKPVVTKSKVTTKPAPTDSVRVGGRNIRANVAPTTGRIPGKYNTPDTKRDLAGGNVKRTSTAPESTYDPYDKKYLHLYKSSSPGGATKPITVDTTGLSSGKTMLPLFEGGYMHRSMVEKALDKKKGKFHGTYKNPIDITKLK